MDDDQTLFEAWTSPFSRDWAIALSWAAMLVFMFWANQSRRHGPAGDRVAKLGPGVLGGHRWRRGLPVDDTVSGYYWLLKKKAVDRSFVARSLAGLRTLLFLIPPVVFTCAFVISATMLLGLFPHQGLGYGAMHAAVYFTWHYLLWLIPGFARYFFPIQSMIIHTNATTEVLAQMCRAAAIVTLIAALAPTLGRNHSHEPA